MNNLLQNVLWAGFMISLILLSIFITLGGIHLYQMGVNGWVCLAIVAIIACASAFIDTMGFIRISELIERL